ncbi:hypothetical protein ACH4S9_08900 [Streptomyces sp. NPDC021225]|uniref:hypothetical protein n=1 Tax=Streptomyces sp. NPDC021225 TaxID=3365121 RepID=UPI0037A2393A
MRTLRIAAAVEAASLAALLINLVTIHTKAITALGGPVHGLCYLTVIVCTFMTPGATPAARRLAVIPGIGGLLVLRRIHPREA